MKNHIIAAAGVALLLVSLAACSSGPTAKPSAALTNAATAPVNNRTYTKDDIAGILNSVNTRLKLGGTVETQDGPQTQPIDALGAYLSGGSPTVVPAHCVEILQSDGQVLGELGNEGVIASVLSSPELTIIATAVAGAPIPASRVASFTVKQRALLNSCKHLSIAETVDGHQSAITVDYKPVTARTTANQTVAFTEHWAITGDGGGSSSSSRTLEAIDGNLLIFVSGVSVQDAPTLERAVNAVVTAAK